MQISIVNYLNLNQEFRIDAEYYRQEVLSRLNILKSKNKNTLGKLANFVIGPFGSTVTVDQYVENSNYRYIRNKDINNFRIINNNPALIPQKIWSSLPQFHIHKNDLLITVVGTLGKVAIATSEDCKSIFSCKSTIIRTININPFYLLAYLNSETGKLFSLRGTRGAIQEGLNLIDLKEIEVFIPAKDFQENVEKTIRQSFINIEKSEIEYKQAQDLLLDELGLNNWQPKHQLSFIKKYSDVQQAERIDAEYYQPKYDDIVKDIKNYAGGWDILENLCELVGHPSNPPYANSNEKDKTFIVAQKHLGDYSLSNDYWQNEDAKYTTEEFISKNKQYLLREEDLVLYTVGAPPHIGKANIFFKTKISSTIGSFVTLVRANKEKINPYYLLVLFNSHIGYELTNRFQRGMVQQYIYPKDLVTTVIPVIPKEKQAQIQQKVTESFKLRQQSNQLLEFAKQAVEMAIKQDEEIAMNWLKNKTQQFDLDAC